MFYNFYFHGNQCRGTAQRARMRVAQHFSDLQETLNRFENESRNYGRFCFFSISALSFTFFLLRQEQVAMETVDTHIRERLSSLRQQQEDLAMLLSHVTAACHQCEVTLKQVRRTSARSRCLQFLKYFFSISRMTLMLLVLERSSKQHWTRYSRTSRMPP